METLLRFILREKRHFETDVSSVAPANFPDRIEAEGELLVERKFANIAASELAERGPPRSTRHLVCEYRMFRQNRSESEVFLTILTSFAMNPKNHTYASYLDFL
jgi:hypothetical protein